MILFENLLRKQAMIPKFVHFEDNDIKNICVTKWGEEGRLSLEKAYQIKELGGDFKEKTFGNFKELALFSSLNGGLSTKTMTNNESVFINSHFDTIQLPEGLKIVPHSMFRSSQGECVIIPSSVTEIDELTFYNARIKKLVLKGSNYINPNRYWSILTAQIKTLYVAPHLVDTYKQSTKWNSQAMQGYLGQVLPLTEYQD